MIIRTQLARIGREGAGDGLVGENDERVAGENRQRLAVFDVDGRLAATNGRIVESRQVVVDERGAMHQLDRGGGGVGVRRIGIAAGHGDRENDLRPDAMAAGKHGVTQR